MEKSVDSLVGHFYETFDIKPQDVRNYSPLTLAYIGDAVYEIIIRTMIIEKGNAPVNKLHKRCASLVKASAQAALVLKIEPLLTEDEMHIFKRGRNAKSYTTAKNASMIDYRMATGFEALVGYLYLNGKFERLFELIKEGLEQQERKK
ncbi:MAG TPA: ribonuclease III [Candidatus Scybalocola faecipullorum]|nr:ribonuclease III [Candidatus Scybalocola faecipullorum]